jgi:hypothetical protein
MGSQAGASSAPPAVPAHSAAPPQPDTAVHTSLLAAYEAAVNGSSPIRTPLASLPGFPGMEGSPGGSSPIAAPPATPLPIPLPPGQSGWGAAEPAVPTITLEQANSLLLGLKVGEAERCPATCDA